MTIIVNYNIKIEPILTDGDPDNGKYLVLGGGQRIDSIEFQVKDRVQQTYLYSGGQRVYYYPYKSPIVTPDIYNPIILESINVHNNIFNPIGQSSFSIKLNDNFGKDLFASPFLDLFRAGDIVRIYYYTNDINASQQIYVGQIAPYTIEYPSKGLSFNVVLENLTNILSRSQNVQTGAELRTQGKILTALTGQQFQFGALLDKFFNETAIGQTVERTIYYGGVSNSGEQEEIAIGKADSTNPSGTSGSAINAQSYVFAYTPPTGTKLDSILQILYPYQRVFYVSPEGNFIITPLTTFYDEEEGWDLDIFGNPDKIPLLNIRVSRNTTVIQNRAYVAFNQIFFEMIQADQFAAPGQANTGVSIATPDPKYFPRAYEFVASNKAVQTSFEVQAVNPKILMQNSGIINTAFNLAKGIKGMSSGVIVDNQNASVTVKDKKYIPVKYITSLYSARKLAESLFADLFVDVTMPTVATFNITGFRELPLNQMVKVPDTNNRLFDGMPQLFCYGFSISWEMGKGSITTLNLCKPYTFTALWADKLQII